MEPIEPLSAPESEQRVVTLADGCRVTFAEHGDPSGRPLVFSHGWPSSRLQGRLCDAAGRRHGWRILTPDRPGIGETTPMPGRTLADWPPLVAGFLDALGIRAGVSLLALSGGAPYALATAAAPGIAGRISGVTVVCGAVPLTEVDDAMVRQMMLPYRVLLAMHRRRSPWLRRLVGLGRHASAIPRDHPLMRALFQFVPPCDREVMRERAAGDCVLESFRLAMANGPESIIADADVLLQPPAFDPSAIRLPVSWWHGGRDRNIPIAMARSFAARLPNADTHWLPDEGHYSLPARWIDPILAAMREPAS